MIVVPAVVHEHLTERVTVGLTRSEKEWMRDAAARARVSMSAYCRAAVVARRDG